MEKREARERSESLLQERMKEEGEKDEIFRDSKKTPWSSTENKDKELKGIIRESNRKIK